MGNCQANSMFSNRNKEFQAVMPFPNENGDAPNPKKRKSTSPSPKSNKTAPSPGGESDGLEIRTSELLDVTKAANDPTNAPSSSAESGPFTDETVQCNVSMDSTYMQTESQQRRERMADCEFECSKITSYLFVGGYHVATNREILRQNGITHIINCSAAVVENAFIDDKSLKYLSLSMVDGRQDDISWFLCEVIQFIMKARSVGGKILIHCEKGISRSCSFAIAYRMWATGEKWKTSFDFVKKGRSICSPNTAFTCNLIELGELLGKDAATTGAGGNLFFRCAYHLPHDPQTAVLKLCRTAESRKIMVPATSLLDPKGVFVIRTVFSNDERVNRDAEYHRLFLWQGAESSDACAKKAEALAKKMHGVLTTTDKVEWVKQGQENHEFLSYLSEDGPFNSVDNSIFDDFYDYPPSEEQTLLSAKQMEADHTRNNGKERDTFGRPTTLRETSIKGFAEFREGPLSRESSIVSALPLISRESSIFSGMPLMSRENSRADRALGAASLSLDLNAVRNGVGLVSRDRSEAKFESSPTANTPALLSSESRRNSDVTAFAYSRIPSLQLPENGLFVEPELNRRTSPSPNMDASLGNKRNVPELTLTGGNKPASMVLMQRVSEGDMNHSEINSSRINSSRDTGRDQDTGRDSGRDAEVRTALPVQVDSPILRFDNTKLNAKRQNSGGVNTTTTVTALTVNHDYISPDVSVEELPRKQSASVIPAVQVPALTPQLSLKLPPLKAIASPDSSDQSNSNSLSTKDSGASNNKSNQSPAATGIATKLSVPLVTSPNDAVMHRQSSAEKLRPGSREMRLFNPTRVAPVPLALGGSSGESPRGGSPRGLDLPLHGGGSRPTSASLNGHSPLTDRRIAGPTASVLATINHGGTSSNSNSTTNLLVSPLKVMERSPSTERNPLDVGLPRGPTAVEDLVTPRTVPRELNFHSPLGAHSHSSHNSPGMGILTPIQVDAAQLNHDSSKASLQGELTKPLLFQAVLINYDDSHSIGKRTAEGKNVMRYEWQAMGVYDDDDLDTGSLFLLLCPSGAHHIWLGSSFPCAEAGMSHMDSETDEPNPVDVLKWAARVLPGEVNVGRAVGKYLLSNPDVTVEMSGEESESFWQDFNDGF